jgi:hypothetical protein
MIHRRQLLLGLGAAGFPAAWSRALALPGRSVSVAEFGARGVGDDTRPIQAAIDAMARNGGGTVVIPGRYRCGNLVILGQNVRLVGRGGSLVNGRLTIAADSRNIEVADLTLLDTRGDARTYLMDVSGQGCRFSNVALIKNPVAGGYQMYVRQQSAACHFDRLRLRGSNGIMVTGSDHLFENFELESKMLPNDAGDDAFAIKALEHVTRNITIRNGIVRGYGSVVSFGSEIGTSKPGGRVGAVRNVTVENVTADRCTRLIFFKPGALDYDWRDGVIEGVRLRNLSLSDPNGRYFRTGIQMFAARGATIRDVQATGIRIVARATDHGVAPTAAVDITLRDKGASARIEDVHLQLSFVDPDAGARHGDRAPGYPVDQIVRIEKQSRGSGSMAAITLDVEGDGASFAGIAVGPELDGAIRVTRAILEHVATDPPGTAGAGGIWSSSRLSLGQVSVDSGKLPKFAGPAFLNRRR